MGKEKRDHLRVTRVRVFEPEHYKYKPPNLGKLVKDERKE